MKALIIPRAFSALSLNTHHVSRKSSLVLSLQYRRSFIRFMLKTVCEGIGNVGKNHLMKLGQAAVPHRNMSFVVSGKWQKSLQSSTQSQKASTSATTGSTHQQSQSGLTNTDTSNHHMVIGEVLCTKPGCDQVNCAENINKSDCRLISQGTNNSQTKANPEFYILGNYTSKVPANKPGVCVDSQKNYAGKSTPQYMVVEQPPKKRNRTDVVDDLAATTFSQDPAHHNVITKATKAKHTNPLP